MPRHPLLASRLDETALAALAFCLPGVAVLLPLGVVPLVLVVALAVAAAELLSGDALSRPSRAIGLAGLLFAGWALLSAVWALDPPWSLEIWARLVPTIAAGGFLVLHGARQPAARRRRLAGWLVAGFAVALAIMLVEGVTDRAINLFLARLVDQAPADGFELNRMNRGATSLAVLAWPAAGALALRLPSRRRFWVLLLPLATTLLLSFYKSDSAILGSAAGLVAALLALPWPRLTRHLILVGTALALLAMPLAAKGLWDLGLSGQKELPFSLRHRIFIWNFTTEETAKRPLLGWGLDASRELAKGAPRFDATHSALPLHPHNTALQIWVELGAVGVLLGGTLLLLALAGLRRGPPFAAALDAGLAVSFLTVGLGAYGIWQYQWLLVPLSAAALMRMTDSQSGDEPATSES